MSYSFPTSPNATIVQRWGNVNATMYPPPSHRHMGVDIGGPVGTPIYAAADGTVVEVNLTGAHGYGRYVIIRHNGDDGDFETLYAHLHKVNVIFGQFVTGGEKIGEMGGQPGDDDPIDGASTGSHLHFEVILQKQPDGDFIKTWRGYAVDPLPFLTRLAYGNPNFMATVISPKGVRVRSRADANAPQIGALTNKSAHPIIKMFDVGENQWAQLWSLRPEYVAVRYGGETLMTVSGGKTESQPLNDAAIRRDEIQRIIDYLEKRRAEL